MAALHRIAPLVASPLASSSRIHLGPLVRASSTLPMRAAHAAPTVRTVSDMPSVTTPPTSAAPKSTGPAPAATDKPAAKPRRQFKPTKAALTMTPNAISRLRALMSSPTEPKMLRIGVKTRGCAGMAYHLDYVDPPGGKFDEVVEQDGVKVLVDSKALFSIIGSVMDWRDTRLSAGFVFENPNIEDTCGCGESFNIRF
ncbi:hypothetical protein CspeluHIS016_0204870 [Cutaneotrichosporon spelunceum]|uniref:Iron-sulfur assembly protein 1 n=1 Tax=Cutaneotrichosporon spelunceum TaxID=1672016 RepID=A0AAD3YA00_9TREE|nr:hypothetical protein CspeluHIS016_0204870 [Cutaneotrichosporon spelunceum]